MSRKAVIVLFAAVVLIVFAAELFLPRTVEIDLSGEGVRYSNTDEMVADVMPLTFRGKLRGTRRGDSDFWGTIDIPALWAELPNGFVNFDEIQYVTVEKTTTSVLSPPNVGFHDKFGQILSPVLVNTVMPKDGAYAIIVPYTIYRMDQYHRGASFSVDDFTFICVGDITREEALQVLGEAYSIS